MFKKPKAKDATDLVTQAVAFEGGKRLSRGLAGVNLGVNPSYARAGILAVSLLAAMSYKGKKKEVVQSALLGAAVEQGGAMIDDYAQSSMNVTDNPDAGTKFLYDMMGLNGEKLMLQGAATPLALPQASLVEVDYAEPSSASSTFTGV